MEMEKMEMHQKSKKRLGKTSHENISDSLCHTNETPSPETHLENCSDSHGLKNAVVVLTRLPEYKISALRPPTPKQFYSEDDSFSSSDSDMQWEAEDDSSDSEFSPIKKKKHSTAAHSSSRNSSNNNETDPLIVSSAFAYQPCEMRKTRPNLPDEELRLDMVVLGRKRSMRWERGKIVEFVTKEDGRLKYKVNFFEKGKSLVSGHHIAYDSVPKLEQLYVGARVVVSTQEHRYRPGVLAELPTRKNRLRFLVFLDDHVPVYVGLPLFHLVCRPLENVLDDIPFMAHKSFLKQYLKDWPYPRLAQYRPGQTLNVEFNGTPQRCVVLLQDCSLMQVLFKESQHKEWIHRGSMRLEHMAKFLEKRGLEQHNNDSD